MDLIQFLFLSALSILSFPFLLIKSLLSPKNKKHTAPVAPGAWPLIGHLAYYDDAKTTHVTFGETADKYGPVFMTKLGSQDVLIISSQEVIKECYTVHDKFLERPSLTASVLLGYNDSFMTFSPYGAYWRDMRKITTSEVLSASVMENFKHCRAGEADVAFRDLYKRWDQKGGSKIGVLVDMKREFRDLASNISLMMVAGKRYFGESPNCEMEEARRSVKLIREFIDYFGLVLFTDVIPALGFLDWGTKRGMKRTAKGLDKLIEGWIEEHKNKDFGNGRDKDFMFLLMEIFKRDKNLGLDDIHATIKALSLNLVLSGSETSIVVLVWAVSLLVNNPDVLRKAHEELDRTIGKERVVEESDIKDLVYIQAIVKETFRLYPSVPLVAYRTVMEDFDIVNGNYHIPAGTQLLVNASKIGKDPSLWSDPEKFEPERFLTTNKDVDFGGQNYKLIAFGLGRRTCPAIHLGLRMVHYILARFLHSFDVERPSSQEVAMTQSNGMVNLKATPLEVIITPRLHQSLYYVDPTV
ncbi:unnamed protein product [Thlaspi arvense]|uniref:Cytochrome P450 n=1 Tax=Thlaspi arvense TaxID=13288 RepID=A0AAU9T4M2_THLAR|nr:unnamed protein product [Thlaspi arvense]